MEPSSDRQPTSPPAPPGPPPATEPAALLETPSVSMDGVQSRPTDPGATEAQAPPAAPPRESVLRFWLRPLILAALVIVLLILSWWDQNRTPSEPLRPSQVATVPATANGMSGTAARP